MGSYNSSINWYRCNCRNWLLSCNRRRNYNKGASPISTLQSRADFTLHVLNLINSVSGDYGLLHGKLIASSLPGSALGPRMMIGKLIAWRSEVTVTPTIIGPMIVDFGRIGVAIGMGLIGFILGIGFKIVEKLKIHFTYSYMHYY